jgi:hypothetical protein
MRDWETSAAGIKQFSEDILTNVPRGHLGISFSDDMNSDPGTNGNSLKRIWEVLCNEGMPPGEGFHGSLAHKQGLAIRFDGKVFPEQFTQARKRNRQ